MDGYVIHGGIGLGHGTLARIEEGAGMLVYVWEGEIWITQEGDRRDYFVRGGQWFRIDRGGATLLHALSSASVTLTAPVRRGRFAGLKDRLAALWGHAFAPFSRPTTAAL